MHRKHTDNNAHVHKIRIRLVLVSLHCLPGSAHSSLCEWCTRDVLAIPFLFALFAQGLQYQRCPHGHNGAKVTNTH